MARIRSIKPGFFRSEDVSALPLRARLTWIGLWTHCDDHGRTKDLTRLIKGDIWPLDDVSLRDIEDDLVALADHGRIVRYEVDGKRYLAIVNWHEHQSINKPGTSKLPAPPVPVGVPPNGKNGHCEECWAADEAAKRGSASGTAPTPGGDDSANVHGARRESVGSGHEALPDDSRRTTGTFPEPSRQEGEGERKGVRRGDAHTRVRDSPSGTTLSTGPPRRCDQHLNDPNPPDCGRCKDARLAAEEWDRQQADLEMAERKARAEAERNSWRWRCRCGTRNPLGITVCRQCNEPTEAA